MKAKTLKIVPGIGYTECPKEEATHIELSFPGPIPTRIIPVSFEGQMDSRLVKAWGWNGSQEAPSLVPSILTTDGNKLRCHSYVTDGKVSFLQDCTHEFAGKLVDLLEVE